MKKMFVLFFSTIVLFFSTVYSNGYRIDSTNISWWVFQENPVGYYNCPRQQLLYSGDGYSMYLKRGADDVAYSDDTLRTVSNDWRFDATIGARGLDVHTHFIINEDADGDDTICVGTWYTGGGPSAAIIVADTTTLYCDSTTLEAAFPNLAVSSVGRLNGTDTLFWTGRTSGGSATDDGNIWISGNMGSSWSFLEQVVSLTQAYRMGFIPDWDNTTCYMWWNEGGGDSMTVFSFNRTTQSFDYRGGHVLQNNRNVGFSTDGTHLVVYGFNDPYDVSADLTVSMAYLHKDSSSDNWVTFADTEVGCTERSGDGVPTMFWSQLTYVEAADQFVLFYNAWYSRDSSTLDSIGVFARTVDLENKSLSNETRISTGFYDVFTTGTSSGFAGAYKVPASWGKVAHIAIEGRDTTDTDLEVRLYEVPLQYIGNSGDIKVRNNVFITGDVLIQ